MKKVQNERSTPRAYLTEEAAHVTRYRPQTLRKELCIAGHFKGIQPIKLPGGRLLWPADEIDALVRGDHATDET